MSMESPFTKEVVEALAERLHAKCFSEEYDEYYDSSSESKNRRRGINPMAREYIDKMDTKRRELGISKLSLGGKPEDNKSKELARQWAVDLVSAHQCNLSQDLSLALFNEDPAGTMCKENDCDDEYDYIAASIIADPLHSGSFKDSLKTALEHAFGNDLFIDPRINDESLSIGERKRLANIDKASELAKQLVRRVVTHYFELFEEESQRVKDPKVQEALEEMKRIQSTRPNSRMGLWGADSRLKVLNNRLDSLHYLGVRPLRRYSPPPR